MSPPDLCFSRIVSRSLLGSDSLSLHSSETFLPLCCYQFAMGFLCKVLHTRKYIFKKKKPICFGPHIEGL
jgi:hypothetical protein